MRLFGVFTPRLNICSDWHKKTSQHYDQWRDVIRFEYSEMSLKIWTKEIVKPNLAGHQTYLRRFVNAQNHEPLFKPNTFRIFFMFRT